LEDGLCGWLDLLHRESARRGSEHALWGHINHGFQTGALTEQARERFGTLYRSFHGSLTTEVDRTARAIYEDLQKKPALLYTLRGSKFAIDAAAIAGTIATAGHNLWLDFLLVPLVASFTHQLVELLGKSVVDAHRESARQRQGALMHRELAGP